MTASALQQGHNVFYKTSLAASHNDDIQGSADPDCALSYEEY